MKSSPEDLLKVLRGGEPGRVAEFFTKATETQRQPFARTVMDWCELLELNWRAQFNTRARQKLAALETIGNYHELMPAAYTAALACASLAQIKAIGFFEHTPDDAVVAVLKDRRPAWLDEYGELVCAGDLRRGFARFWRRVRALVRAGLCRPPRHPNYALGALEGIWPPFNHPEQLRRQKEGKPRLPEPDLVELLLAERDWLDTAFWRLFETDGTGEVSLANCEKYGKSRQTWTEAISELSRRGVLSRERLLDDSLAALSHDFIQYRAGWFSRFHEALKPTPEERAQRSGACLNLLASSIPPTMAFAMEAVDAADHAKPLPAAKLLPALSPALNARGKNVVITALQLLDRVAAREPAARREACLAAVAGLLNEATDVQRHVLDLLERHGDKQDAALRRKMAEAADAVAASLRSRLKPWLEAKPGAGSPTIGAAKKTKTPASPPAMVPRTDPSRAVQPVTNLDDLLHLAAAVLEEPEHPHDIERVLDGISRLCDQRPEDFDRRTGPLRKRALKKRDDRRGTMPQHSILERALAMVFLSWLEGKDAFTGKPEDMGHGQNQFSFLFHRLQTLGRRAAERRALPLLSAPTHLGGWIEAGALVEHWLAWQNAGETPDLREQVLALLRLAPENRAASLNAAKAVKGEAGQALRFALGEAAKTGKDAALWLAAWRSRQPHGDLPEFEKAHPKLGPDAGTGAEYNWRAWSERHTSGTLEWTSLELELTFGPKRPPETGDAFLPVLVHGGWMTSEEGEKPLLRWAARLWPANHEAFFARAAKRLEISVDYADALDCDFCAYLEPLADPHTELRPMACLALALGLAAQDAALRSHAQEGLIAAISEGRLNAPELGSTMSRLLDTGVNKLVRWAKGLREIARVSPAHMSAAAELLQRALHGDPAKAPRDLGALLELLVELLSETGAKLEDAGARNYLSEITAGGKSAKLAKVLLNLN